MGARAHGRAGGRVADAARLLQADCRAVLVSGESEKQGASARSCRLPARLPVAGIPRDAVKVETSRGGEVAPGAGPAAGSQRQQRSRLESGAGTARGADLGTSFATAAGGGRALAVQGRQAACRAQWQACMLMWLPRLVLHLL
jgi:hypothetical protein